MCKKISIIIPCYNTEKYIDRCLTSLITQTIGLEHLAIICVNDASTDTTQEKLENWEKRYPNNITVINRAKNGRIGGARNIAFPYITTSYVSYVDSDDWVEPDMYEKMYQKAESHHCDIVYCGMLRDSGDIPDSHRQTLSATDIPTSHIQIPSAASVPMPSSQPASTADIPVPNQDAPPASWLLTIDSVQERKKFIVHNTIKYSACDKLIRTDFLKEHQITFPENLAYEDLYWGSMLYLYAKTICIMEHKFYHYYINPNATVLSTDRPYHKDILKINQMRWEMYAERNAFADYRHEIEYDFLVSGYLSALKILSLRFTTDTWDDYQNLCHHTLACIPDLAANPYLSLFTDFQKLQLQILEHPLLHQEWLDYCHFIKTHPNMK